MAESALHRELAAVVDGIRPVGTDNDGPLGRNESHSIHTGIELLIDVEVLSTRAHIGRSKDEVTRQLSLNVKVPLDRDWIQEVARYRVDRGKWIQGRSYRVQ